MHCDLLMETKITVFLVLNFLTQIDSGLLILGSNKAPEKFKIFRHVSDNFELENYPIKEFEEAKIALTLVACNDFYNCKTQFYNLSSGELDEETIEANEHLPERLQKEEPSIPDSCTSSGEVTIFSGPIEIWPEKQLPSDVQDIFNDFIQNMTEFNGGTFPCNWVELIKDPSNELLDIWKLLLERLVFLTNLNLYTRISLRIFAIEFYLKDFSERIPHV